MLSESVQSAVATLQQRALKTSDTFELERIERALDQLLRTPGNSTPPAALIYSSLGHASEVLIARRRRTGGVVLPLEAEAAGEAVFDPRIAGATSATESGYVDVEFTSWLATTPGLGASERMMLQALARDEDVASLAERYQTSTRSMSQRLSRARRRGRTAYDREVRSA